MRPKRLTGLAAKAVEYRDKVEGSREALAGFKQQLGQGGEDYADAVNQVDEVERQFDKISDMLIDLSVLILKADKVKATASAERAVFDEGRPDEFVPRKDQPK